MKNLDEFWANIDSLNFIKFDSDVISGKPWGLTDSPTLFRIINNNHPKYQPLINIATPFNGIQTSAEKIYSFEKRDLIVLVNDKGIYAHIQQRNWNGPTFMGYNGSIKILQKFKIEIKRLQLK